MDVFKNSKDVKTYAILSTLIDKMEKMGFKENDFMEGLEFEITEGNVFINKNSKLNIKPNKEKLKNNKIKLKAGIEKKEKINPNNTYIRLIEKMSDEVGYQGYAFLNLYSDEIYVVHRGSQDLSTVLEKPKENLNDWSTDLMIIFENDNQQIYSAYEFLNMIKKKYPDKKIIQIGQSLGGNIAEILGSIKINEGIETITFNPLGAKKVLDELVQKDPEKFVLSDNLDNISNFRYKNELITKITEHSGNIYSSDYVSKDKYRFHNMESHQEKIDGYILEPSFEVTKNDEDFTLTTLKKVKDNFLNFLSKIKLILKNISEKLFQISVKNSVQSNNKTDEKNSFKLTTKDNKNEELKNISSFSGSSFSKNINDNFCSNYINLEGLKNKNVKVVEEVTLKDGFIFIDNGEIKTISENDLYNKFLSLFSKDFKEAYNNRSTRWKYYEGYDIGV